MCGSTTTESAAAMASQGCGSSSGSGPSANSLKKPPYAAVHVDAHAVPCASSTIVCTWSTAPRPVVPAVATTVPTRPDASCAASASRSIRPGLSAGTGDGLDAEHAAHPGVRVVRLGAEGDATSGCSDRATYSASRLAIVPLEVRWPRCCGVAEHRREAR